jgi:hypothetical protein
MRQLICPALLLLTLSACAGSDDPSPFVPADMALDMAAADMAPDLPQDMGPDLAPDLAQDMPVDMRCGVCCPEDVMCSPSGMLAQCKPDGSGFTETSCGAEKECAQGACVDKKICEPGSKMCFDGQSQLVCRANGTGYATQDCEAGASCINGECLMGELNGAECAAADECAGELCHCGDGEQCPASFTRSYCAAACGPQTACGPSEWCLASSVHALPAMGATYDHCITRCQGSCPLPGMACKQVPVYDAQGKIDWQDGCYFPSAKQVGDVCDSDAECLGGSCLKGLYLTGVCSLRCESTACPGDAACVELVPGQRWCSQLCGDGSVGSQSMCPLDVPTDRFDVTCKVRQSSDRGAVRVCDKT